jgi:hypothetical protein
MNHVIGYKLITDEFNAYRSLQFDELRQLIGEHKSRLVRREGVDYDLTVTVAWYLRIDGDIIVRVIVGEANWGSPLDSVDEQIVISRPSHTTA